MTQSGTQFLRLLGPCHISHTQTRSYQRKKNKAGHAPRFRSQRTIALLGYLAIARRPVARPFLATLFWPDETVSNGRTNLRRELHNLAQILPHSWESNRQTVAFIPSTNVMVDLDQLQQLEAQERWDEASELLRGEFLEGLHLENNPEFENWLLGERERWRGNAETVLRRLIEGHTRRGRYADALHWAWRLLQMSPWDEETHRCIMRFLAWTGQRGAALRQFESCQRALTEELGVEPALETIALYQQIQGGKLDLPPQLPAFLTEEKARHAYERPFFVSRESELAQLDRFLDDALAGQGRVIFISGGPGRGKTALLEAFVQQAMERLPHLLVVGGKCNAYSDVGDPYLPYREAMAMLTGDVEGRWDAGAISQNHARRLWAAFPLVIQALLEHGSHLMGVLTPGTALLDRAIIMGQADAPWLSRLREQVNRQGTSLRDVEQSFLFQQVANVLDKVARERPLLLILDDIQWADAASISLLFHMGQRFVAANSRLLIVCAYRPEEVAMGRNGARHPLAKVLTEFKRVFGNVWVNLGHVEEEENRRFMDALLDIERNQLGKRFRTTLFDRTDGHPLFTLELLRAMKERGDLRQNADGAWIEGATLSWQLLPARVEAVVEERIDRLEPDLQEILAVASVEGELFTAQVVAEALQAPERVILRRLSQDLERRHGLVREEEEVEVDLRRMSRYRFGHVLFQDYLYKRLGQGERRALHGDVATALERLYARERDRSVVQLAHHFYQAGDYRNAFHYSAQSAERAVRIYESREAIRHYTRAIQLAEKVDSDAASLTRLHRGRGLAFEKLGEFEQARSDHTAVLETARAANNRQVAWQALLDLGKLWASRDYNQTHAYFEEALKLARQIDDPALLAISLNWVGNWCANAEKPLAAANYHQEALAIVETSDDRRGLANTLDLLGIAHFMEGNLPISARYYDRAITLFQELDDLPRLVSSLTGRAATVSMLAFLTSIPASPSFDANADVEKALQIAKKIGLASGETWAYWAWGLLCTVNGRFGQAKKMLQSGLHIASAIEHREFAVGNLFALGILYIELFAPELAQKQLEEAAALAKELRSSTLIRIVNGTLAKVYMMLNNFQSAQESLESTLLPQTPMDSLGKRYCWARRAELTLIQNDPALTLDITERLIESAPGMSSEQVITFLWMLKAEALAAIGRKENAILLLHAAIENAGATGERFLLWRAHANLGRLYRAINCQTEAQKIFSVARGLIQELAVTITDEALKENFIQRADESVNA